MFDWGEWFESLPLAPTVPCPKCSNIAIMPAVGEETYCPTCGNRFTPEATNGNGR